MRPTRARDWWFTAKTFFAQSLSFAFFKLLFVFSPSFLLIVIGSRLHVLLALPLSFFAFLKLLFRELLWAFDFARLYIFFEGFAAFCSPFSSFSFAASCVFCLVSGGVGFLLGDCGFLISCDAGSFFLCRDIGHWLTSPFIVICGQCVSILDVEF